MGLLTETLSRISAQRLGELTNSDNAGGLKNQAVSGTSLAVTNGSTAVVGTATTFTGFGVNIVIQFASQPGVSYVVATITDNTHLTLLTPYQGVTNAATSAVLPAINYQVLQDAVYDAQAHFFERTDVVFDDTTTAAAGNKCFWVGVPLVIAYLYEFRAQPWPEGTVEKVWDLANRRLTLYLNNSGDGAYAPPQTDSPYQPSTLPFGTLPTFDDARLTGFVPWAPGPSDASGSAGGSPNDWTG
jgi:hypothetical protein